MESTVFIVDDDSGVRSSLLFMLRAEGLTCRAFPCAASLLQQLEPTQRGCIVTDIRMPGMDGLALIHRLNEIGCHMPVIVITGHGDVPVAVRAMRAGVVDFIEKPFTSTAILASIRQCLDLSDRAAERETEYEAIKRRKDRLTERESQVMNQLVLGKSNKEVALILKISPRTVEVYRTNIMSKMQASSLAELVRINIKFFGVEINQAS